MRRKRRGKRQRSMRPAGWESWNKRVTHHRETVKAAATPEAQLWACFDRFRSQVAHGGLAECQEMTRYLISQADQMADINAKLDRNPRARSQRGVAAIRAGQTPLAYLRASWNWYRAELAVARRRSAGDIELTRALGADMHEVASRLNAAAVRLEQASEPKDLYAV